MGFVHVKMGSWDLGVYGGMWIWDCIFHKGLFRDLWDLVMLSRDFRSKHPMGDVTLEWGFSGIY